jgi:hypothetical protein
MYGAIIYHPLAAGQKICPHPRVIVENNKGCVFVFLFIISL